MAKLKMSASTSNKFFSSYTGFTLIEVLVALVILAVALIAVVKIVNLNIEDTAYVKDRIVARWVGNNVINNMQAGLITPPQNDATQGRMRMLNKTWYWQAQPEQQNNPYIRRVEIRVSDKQEGKSLARLYGFIWIAKNGS